MTDKYLSLAQDTKRAMVLYVDWALSYTEAQDDDLVQLGMIAEKLVELSPKNASYLLGLLVNHYLAMDGMKLMTREEYNGEGGTKEES